MILWTFKLIRSVRKAIAGRRYPAQLAWAVAFGILLGLIPHGNFVTVALVLLILSLKLNHAMAALVTIGVTFAAANFDNVFHDLGFRVLSHPSVASQMTTAWHWPMMPWTDLNNTVVMGSLLIGLAALIPTFALTYPVFKYWSLGLAVDDDAEVVAVPVSRRANRPKRSQQKTSEPTVDKSTATAIATSQPHDVRRIDAPQSAVPAPHNVPKPEPKPTQVEVRPLANESVVPPPASARTPANSTTRRNANTAAQASRTPGDDQQKIDEALRYLLRQLRDSQEKDAA